MPPRSFNTTFSKHFGVVGNLCEVKFFEHQAAGFEARAMAADAILVEQGSLGCGCAGTGCGGSRLLRSRR